MRKVANTDAPITAKDIGRQLGLSQPTVSRVLSGASGHRISDETRRRVLEAAEKMGYRPNAIARSLRRRRTNIIGFYTGYGYLDARNPFQAELIGSLQRACDQHRLDLLLHGVFRSASTDDIFGELVNGRIDGLFINTHADDPLVSRLRSSSLPVVAIADAIAGIPSVVPDDEAGTRLLLDYFWERGHRRIGYLRPRKRFTSVERRVAAFRAWCAEHHISAESSPQFDLEYEFTDSGLDALMALPAETRPTAVCCWNDMTACDLLYRCRSRGIPVPEGLAVAGFDALRTDPRLNPRGLLTVGASWTQIATCAMNYLIRQIQSRAGPVGSPGEEEQGALTEIPSLTCLPVTLVQGDTV